VSIFNMSNRAEGIRARLSGETVSVHARAWTDTVSAPEEPGSANQPTKFALSLGGGNDEEE
jgi:hypothetical protein